VPRLPATDEKAPLPGRPERVMSPREAALSEAETVPAGESAGRVLAAAAISCPPAVPVVMCGERIDARAAECFEYYGVRECTVVKQ
ncbi:MAG: amino acid decarboxylase, partial [Oscillospiraceae bacterium]|nr:amino acid decarboxylase [Oscillospiraceae bacterium]